MLDFSEHAPLVIRKEQTLAASPARVWDALVDVQRWHHWHRGVHFAVLRGALQPGTVMHWRADGMRFRSVLGVVDPGRCVGWTLRTPGARGYQRWTLEGTPSGGTTVRLEESWEGLVVHVLKRTLKRTLDVSRREWMEGLARASSASERTS
jgi:uncharacterized protein YndB with AHSA1/START domain